MTEMSINLMAKWEVGGERTRRRIVQWHVLVYSTKLYWRFLNTLAMMSFFSFKKNPTATTQNM